MNVTLAGGGFGRRVADDFVMEAVDLSKRARRPVQVVWTREDDLQHDWYRPCSTHRLEARLADDGLPVAWRHRIVAPSILRRDPNFREAVDPTAVEGAKDLPYRVPDLQVEVVRADLPLPLGFWRSVGHSYNAFAVECFVDEIAATAQRDPATLRQSPKRFSELRMAWRMFLWRTGLSELTSIHHRSPRCSTDSHPPSTRRQTCSPRT